jgi:virulence-associated protein VagC
MSVVTSRTFKSGNSAAVRLPKEVAFEHDTEVNIIPALTLQAW